MKLNRKWLLSIALVLSMTVAIGGTLAYLTDRDTVENTFTMGSVDITVEEDFPKAGAPIRPGQEVNKDARIYNNGANPAWVWMTVSVPEGLADHVTLKWADGFAPVSATPTIENGQAVWTVLVDEPLLAGERTDYILDSVTLSKFVDYQGGEYVVVVKNDDGTVSTEPLIGIVNGTLPVTVTGYAVQADGLNTAVAAYNGYQGQYPGTGTRSSLVDSPDSAFDSTLSSGSYILVSDYVTSDATQSYSANRAYAVRDDKIYTLDLNGHTITHDTVYGGMTYLYTVAYRSTLIINGDGTIVSTNGADHASAENCIVYAQSTGTVILNGGNYHPENGAAVWAGTGAHITINGGNYVSTGDTDCELIYSSGGIIDIYGGFFHNQTWDGRPVNVADANRGTGFINIYGGTFVNLDPSTGGNDPGNIRVAEGYKVISEEQENGDIWYTVVPE